MPEPAGTAVWQSAHWRNEAVEVGFNHVEQASHFAIARDPGTILSFEAEGSGESEPSRPRVLIQGIRLRPELKPYPPSGRISMVIGVAICKNGPSLSVSGKTGSFLLLLPDPVVQVVSLEFCGAPDEVRMRYPQPIGKKPLSRRQNLDFLTADLHPVNRVKHHVRDGNGLVKIVLGHRMNLGNDAFKSVDRSHSFISFR
jgi:hypothetical protein